MSAIDDVGEVEDRQEHANDHAADDNSQEDNQHGFKERHEAGERGFNFFVEKVRDALEHVVNVAGLFAGAQHTDDHAGENRVLAERGGNAFAPFNVKGGGLDGFFHDDVADGLRDNLQHFQDGHAATNERGERAREADQADFMRNGAENRQLDAPGIPKHASRFGLDEMKPTPYSRDRGDDKQEEKMFDDVADIHHELGWSGQLRSEAGVNFLEGRDDFHQQEDRDGNRHDGHGRRIHQRGLDLFTKAFGIFQVSGQSRENFGKQTALFARRHHGIVKAVECLRMLLQRLGKTFAAFNARAHVPDHIAHDLVRRLVRQRLQGLHDGNARLNHRRQLAGENDQVVQRHLAALHFASFGDLFLDGHHQKVAVKQRGNGGLFSHGFDRAVDFPAGGRLPG